MSKEIAQKIRAGYGDMRKSEQKAADFILEHLDMAASFSLDRLALEAGVSQPTVMRMLKKIGYESYREFRNQLLLAAELAKAEEREKSGEARALYGYPLHPGERLEDIPRNMVTMTERMLGETLKNFSVRTYKKIVEALKKARIIDIYSVENSEVTAQDLLAKLLYLGFSCRHFTDHYYQRISAGSLTEADVAVGISYSGSSKDTVDVMRTAKKSGATTIVITNFKDSPIKGRPYPYMIFRNMEALGIDDVHKVLKVGDTASDIKEGKHAGVWSAGVVIGSSEMGLSEEEYQALSPEEQEAKCKETEEKFYAAGADLVFRTLQDLAEAL